MNIRYYIIDLKNIFLKDSETNVVFGVYENGKYYDLLTNKEIYMIESLDSISSDFLNSNCYLIGIKKVECSADKVSLFLKFITESAKEILIEEVNEMEKSIKNSLNESNLGKKLKNVNF